MKSHPPSRRGFNILLLVLMAMPAALAARPVRVGIYQNSPKVAMSAAGEPEGIFVDLIEAIAAAEGWTLEYVPGTWAQGLDRLEAAEIDLMPDVALTQAREAKFAFHREPVLSDWFQVYARRGSGIRSVMDLNGKRLSLLERSIQQEALEQAFVGFDLNMVLVKLPDYEAAFAAVERGETDAVIANRFYGAAHGAAKKLHDTAIIFNPTRLYFAASKHGDQLMLAAIDRHLVRLKEEPTSLYYRSLQRWTSEDVAVKLPAWLKYAGMIAAGLLLLSLFGSAALKHRVSVRTRQLALRNEQLQAMIAQAKHAEQALRESELKFRMVFETANDAILLMKKDRFLDCNARTLTIYGCRREQIIGAPPYEFSPPFQPDGRRSDEKALEKINLALTKEPQFFEWQHCRRDGTPFMAEVSLSRFQLRDEVLLQVFVRDITKRKQVEEALKELNASLELRVAARTTELAVARDRAEQADRMKSAFLATMSHELRTPLNSIIGFTGIILQGLAGPLNAEQNKQLGMARDSARHLLALINDVLDISKIEAGQLKVHIEPFDLRATIIKAASSVKPLAEKKGLALRTDIGPEIGRLASDPRRVEQILLNLLNNAIKFTEQGAVTLTAELAPPGAIRIAVADTGIGIKPEDLGALFQPFRQIDSGLTRQHEGTGLGLAICRRLAEQLGGQIQAASDWGKGSVFTLTLPVKGPGTA